MGIRDSIIDYVKKYDLRDLKIPGKWFQLVRNPISYAPVSEMKSKSVVFSVRFNSDAERAEVIRIEVTVWGKVTFNCSAQAMPGLRAFAYDLEVFVKELNSQEKKASKAVKALVKAQGKNYVIYEPEVVKDFSEIEGWNPVRV
jgi:hypothetical protein